MPSSHKHQGNRGRKSDSRHDLWKLQHLRRHLRDGDDPDPDPDQSTTASSKATSSSSTTKTVITSQGTGSLSWSSIASGSSGSITDTTDINLWLIATVGAGFFVLGILLTIIIIAGCCRRRSRSRHSKNPKIVVIRGGPSWFAGGSGGSSGSSACESAITGRRGAGGRTSGGHHHQRFSPVGTKVPRSPRGHGGTRHKESQKQTTRYVPSSVAAGTESVIGTRGRSPVSSVCPSEVEMNPGKRGYIRQGQR